MSLLDAINLNDPGGPNPSPSLPMGGQGGMFDPASHPATQSMAGQTNDILARVAQQGGSSGGGSPRIQNLLQLGAIAKNLAGVPPEIRNRILSQLLGIPYKSPEEKTMDIAKAHYALGAQDRATQQARLMESLKNREQIGQMRLAAQKASQQEADKYRAASLQRQNDLAASNLASSIGKITNDMKLLQPGSKEYMDLARMLNTQHQLYKKYADMGLSSGQGSQELQDQQGQSGMESQGDQGGQNGSEGSAY